MNCCNKTCCVRFKCVENRRKSIEMSVEKTEVGKLCGIETREVAVPSNSIEELSPTIFHLNVDCFEEIFDYLSLKELHAFGQTCRLIQQMSGDYFYRNFKSAEKFSGNDGIYTVYSNHEGVSNERIQTNGFNQFINCISHYYEEIEPLQYIQSHSDEFTTINHIYLVCLVINPIKIEYLQKVLPKIDVIQLRQCTLMGDFYETLLSFCKNLRCLHIQDDLGDIIDESGNPWMLRKYQNLEVLQLTLRYPFRILELRQFLEINSNLKCFSTSSRCLWENRHEILECKTRIDLLEIQMLDNFYRQLIDMRLICELLNQLYEHGFYQRLHLFVKRVDQKCSELLNLVYGLEHLSIRQFSESYNLSLLINLKVLAIFDGSNSNDMDILAKKLVNLERIHIQNADYSDILPFIRRSIKLTRIKMAPKDNGPILRLRNFNEDREKLRGARKITIYVPDNVFLTTKWTEGDINLNMIELKRTDSYQWDQHY